MEFSPSIVLICPSKIVGYICVTPCWVGTVLVGVIALMFAFAWGVAAVVGVAGGSGAG